MWTIYEHISPSGNIYIGITSQDIKNRWKYGTGYKGNQIFYKAIKKYGWDNIIHRIIATNLGEMTAKNMEKDLIAFNKAKGISYNITDGGDGALGRKLSQETKDKISLAHLGKHLSKEHIEKCTKHLTGRKWTESQRVKFKAAYQRKKEEGYTFKGHTCSEENKEKLRTARLGVLRPLEVIEKIKANNKQKKSVNQLTSDGKFIRTFDSINDAVRATGISKKSISRCCRNMQSIAGEFKWEFNHDN